MGNFSDIGIQEEIEEELSEEVQMISAAVVITAANLAYESHSAFHRSVECRNELGRVMPFLSKETLLDIQTGKTTLLAVLLGFEDIPGGDELMEWIVNQYKGEMDATEGQSEASAASSGGDEQDGGSLPQRSDTPEDGVWGDPELGIRASDA